MNIQLTKRDLAMMRWINGVGFVRIDHIRAWLNVAKPTAYARVKKLVWNDYLAHDRVFHGVPGVYRVALPGVQISGSSLPIVKHISRTTYDHDLLVTTLCLNLSKRYACSYTPERALRHELGKSGIGQSGHMPDGVLHLPGKRIAIEVELSKKGHRRLEKILQQYRKNFDYQEVWYFCASAEIERRLEAYLDKTSFIKVYSLADYLDERRGSEHE